MTGEAFIERRRQLVRDEIGQIAISLFAERGFDAVTVADISEAANISERTFFRYFLTKDEVVIDYETKLLARLTDLMASRPEEEGPVTALRKAYLATSFVLPEDRPRIVELGRILANAPALRATANGHRLTPNESLLKAVSSRMNLPATDFRPRTVIAVMSAAAGAEWSAWLEEGGEGNPSERIGEALALVEAGLATLEQRSPQQIGVPHS